MRLAHGIHLAYCTNVHRGGNWAETFATADAIAYDGKPDVKMGREFLLKRKGRPQGAATK